MAAGIESKHGQIFSVFYWLVIFSPSLIDRTCVLDLLFLLLLFVVAMKRC